MSVPIYLVAAYLVFWALPLLLLLSIWSRQRRLDRQLEDLRLRTER
ncbi:MAG: hypothetical protein HPY83_01290 [Anaerolineae bacterium]|nr:hypothetical protein [Anaerolineae bacterium]